MKQDVGTYDTISEDELLASCRMELRLNNTTSEDAYILQQINMSLRSLKNAFTLVPAIADLPITNTGGTIAAKTPAGFIRLDGQYPIRIYNSSNPPTLGDTTTSPVMITPNAPTLTPDGFFKGAYNTGFTAKVVNGYIYFGGGVSDDMCQISYISTNVDAEGNLSIPVDAERAIVCFVASRYYRSVRDVRNSISYDMEWARCREYLVGKFNQSDSLEKTAISNIMNKFPVYR